MKNISPVAVLAAFIFLCISPTVQAQDRLPANDPRYAEYVRLSNAYEDLYERFVSDRDETSRARVTAEVKLLKEQIDALRAQDSPSHPEYSKTSENLARRLGTLSVSAGWEEGISNPLEDEKRRLRLDQKNKPPGLPAPPKYRPYRRYLEYQQKLDQIEAALKAPNVTAAQKRALLARLKTEVIDNLDGGYKRLTGLPAANQISELNQLYKQLLDDAKAVERANTPAAAATDRQALKRELEGYKREIEQASAVFLRRFDLENIDDSLRAEFTKIGTTDFSGNASAWTQSYYSKFVASGGAGGTVYNRTVEVLGDSIRNLTTGRSFTREEATRFRERMLVYREASNRLTLLLNQRLRLAAEANADLEAVFKKKTMKKEEKDARATARQPRIDQIAAEIEEIRKNRIFPAAIGSGSR